MCGIFGYFNYRGDGDSVLSNMADSQVHRGPDSEGFFKDGYFGFGIRRLSIIDLLTGDQPVHNEDSTVWVVCNGEIYNYVELRKELEGKGHIFYTNSDVECIVHLYEDHGIKALEKLNGMFGLALYDKKLKKLFIARDRLGIKPLYFSLANGVLFFSSELRSILVSGVVDVSFDWDGISHFLDLLYIPAPMSPFKTIRKMKAGSYMEISGEDISSISEKKYWDINDISPVLIPSTEEEAMEKLTFLLMDSSKIQLRADVPICVFLSGGIDSSAVAAFASMNVSQPLKTFHVYFEGATNKRDEREQARKVSQRYGTDHIEVSVGRNDFKKLIPRLIWHLEEPFGDLASIPTFIISEMARKHALVCLNGSGGDELFAGYIHHDNIFQIKRSLVRPLEMIGVADSLRNMLGKEVRIRSWSEYIPEYRKNSDRMNPDDAGKTFRGDRMNKIMARDIDGYLQSNVLFLLDKIAMAVSLEGRVPLLDHRFVEIASHIPSRLKIKNGQRKYIFKKMLEPYLPEEVLNKKKEGFGAPLLDWLDETTTTMLRDVIRNGRLKKEGMLNIKEKDIETLSGWDLWKISCLDLWSSIVAHSGKCPTGMTLEDYT